MPLDIYDVGFMAGEAIESGQKTFDRVQKSIYLKAEMRKAAEQAAFDRKLGLTTIALNVKKEQRTEQLGIVKNYLDELEHERKKQGDEVTKAKNLEAKLRNIRLDDERKRHNLELEKQAQSRITVDVETGKRNQAKYELDLKKAVNDSITKYYDAYMENTFSAKEYRNLDHNEKAQLARYMAIKDAAAIYGEDAIPEFEFSSPLIPIKGEKPTKQYEGISPFTPTKELKPAEIKKEKGYDPNDPEIAKAIKKYGEDSEKFKRFMLWYLGNAE